MNTAKIVQSLMHLVGDINRKTHRGQLKLLLREEMIE